MDSEGTAEGRQQRRMSCPSVGVRTASTPEDSEWTAVFKKLCPFGLVGPVKPLYQRHCIDSSDFAHCPSFYPETVSTPVDSRGETAKENVVSLRRGTDNEYNRGQ